MPGDDGDNDGEAYKPRAPRPVWHRDPLIKPRTRTQRLSMLPPTKLSKAIVHDNVGEERHRDNRLRMLEQQQRWVASLHDHQKRCFVVRQLLIQQYTPPGKSQFLPQAVAQAYQHQARFRCLYYSYNGGKDLPLYHRLKGDGRGFNLKESRKKYELQDPPAMSREGTEVEKGVVKVEQAGVKVAQAGVKVEQAMVELKTPRTPRSRRHVKKSRLSNGGNGVDKVELGCDDAMMELKTPRIPKARTPRAKHSTKTDEAKGGVVTLEDIVVNQTPLGPNTISGIFRSGRTIKEKKLKLRGIHWSTTDVSEERQGEGQGPGCQGEGQGPRCQGEEGFLPRCEGEQGVVNLPHCDVDAGDAVTAGCIGGQRRAITLPAITGAARYPARRRGAGLRGHGGEGHGGQGGRGPGIHGDGEERGGGTLSRMMTSLDDVRFTRLQECLIKVTDNQEKG